MNEPANRGQRARGYQGRHRKAAPAVAEAGSGREIFGVLRDIGLVSIGKYGQYLVTVATLPLIARVLGAEGLGTLAVGMAAYFIGSLLVDLGITSYISARVQGPRPNVMHVNELRGTYLVIRGAILGVLAVALAGSLLAGAPEHLHMIFLGLFVGGFWSMSEDWVLIGQGRFGASVVYQGVARVGYLLLLILVLPHFPNASMAMLCLLASAVVSVGLTWFDTWRRFGPPGRPRKVRALLRIGGPVLTSRLLVTSYGQGAAAAYGVVLNAASLGLFSAADRLVRAVQSLLDPIGFALLPRMARRTHRGFWRDSSWTLAACVGLAVLVAAMAWAAAPLLIHLIFGDEFAEAVTVLRAEVLILPATTITSFITTAVLPVRQDSAGVLVGGFIGTAVAALALGVAAWSHSLWALVWGIVLAEFAVACWYIVRMRWLFVRDLANATQVTTLLPVVRKERR